ncbi:hypothetical protein K1719_019776 [Acacia pycnantha]|nr:hypothetical protein K1719_019776 [Acacia pycnantha]
MIEGASAQVRSWSYGNVSKRDAQRFSRANFLKSQPSWKTFLRHLSLFTSSEIQPRPVPMGKRIFSCRKNISKTGFGGNLQCSHYLPSPFPEDSSLPCVIYCHGNSGCRADANEAAVILLPSNITVFTLDFSGSSLSEMVDDIIRSQAEKLQPANELTRTRLKEMELPDSILALEGNLTLPAHLRRGTNRLQLVLVNRMICPLTY